jgi:glucose/arabinose dehydrogenase
VRTWLVALPIFACACSSEEANTLKPSPAPDAATPDAGADARADAGPEGPECTITDLAPGTGTKFCDLPGTDASEVEVPPGFCVREFTTTAAPVLEARVLKFAPNGDLFVTAPSMTTVGGASLGRGVIAVLPDDDGDGRADSVIDYAGPSPATGTTICSNLEADPNALPCVHGLVFSAGYVYFTRSDEVRRWPYVAGDRKAPASPSELVAKLGHEGIADVRWAHTLEEKNDGTILVSRGRGDTDSCSEEQMTRGAVFSLNVKGTASTPALPLTPELVADGFRNPMYLRCSPASCGECYASELSGDNWDSIGGREKLALLEKGSHWGYPCCVGLDQLNTLPGVGATSANCANLGKELVAIKLHDTNFGLDFDRGGFPEPYRHGLFVALHGVFTSFGGTSIVYLGADPRSLRPATEPKLFAKGFAPNGRATDVVFAPDGRLFVADDTSGKIYWIAPRTLAKRQ